MDSFHLETKLAGALRFLEREGSKTLFRVQAGFMREAEYLGPGQYRFLDPRWRKTSLPLPGAPGKTVFFRSSIPAQGLKERRNLSLRFDLYNLEALLFLEGKPYYGIDQQHKIVPLPSSVLKKGEIDWEVEISFEGRFTSRPENPHLFSGVELVEENPAFSNLYYHLKVALEAWQEVEDKTVKKMLEEVLLASLRALEAEDHSSICRAADILEKVLFSSRRSAGRKDSFSLTLIGHSHIDTAWLWTLSETVRKCGRTFSTALRLIEAYPDFKFCASQPQLYQYAKEFYPEIYQKIKELVKKRQWEPLGAFWVEPDCNLISGESLARQIFYGKMFFQEEFGVETKTAWLPDTFGFAASLPQVLKEAGVDYFYTNKLFWQAGNRFPYNLFWWEGIDGTRILAHVPKLFWYYNGFPNPKQLKIAEMEFRQKEAFSECLFPFGWGDGGGGVSLDQLNYARRLKNFPGLPQTKFGFAEDYFRRAVKGSANLPVWKGELYLETHQGCYTSQAAVKFYNRLCERLLGNVEMLGALNAVLRRRARPQDLSHLWKKVLTFQFHDILAGSSISAVYQEIIPQYNKIVSDLKDEATKNLLSLPAKKEPSVSEKRKEAYLFFNPLNWERTEVVEVKPKTFVEVDLPPCGYVICRPGEENRREQSQPLITVKTAFLENRYFLIRLDKNGRIIRLFDKVNQKEVLPEGTTANDFLIFKDGPLSESAWNIDPDYESRLQRFGTLVHREIIRSGPILGILRQVFQHKKSTLTQEIIIYQRIPRIDFRTEVFWQEKWKMLKVAFPVTVKAKEAFYEIPFGMVARPTTNKNSWEREKKEVAAHTFADLSEKDYGVSLLNDSKYGYDIKGNLLRLTLLRSPDIPDPEADQGLHRFTYSLLPHRGNQTNPFIFQQAHGLNQPVLFSPLGKKEITNTRVSFLKTEGLPVVLSAFKISEDGKGIILRVYEPCGLEGKVVVNLYLEKRVLKGVWTSNFLEERKRKIAFSDNRFSFFMGPFKIKTFFLKIS